MVCTAVCPVSLCLTEGEFYDVGRHGPFAQDHAIMLLRELQLSLAVGCLE